MTPALDELLSLQDHDIAIDATEAQAVAAA